MWRRRTAAAAIPLIFLVHVATSAVVSVLDQPNARLITWGAKHGCEIRIDRHIQFGNVIPKTKQCFVRVTLPVTYEIDGEAFTLAAAESSTTTVTAVFGDIATTTSEPKAKHRATAHPGAILPALKKHVEEDVYQHVMYLGDIGYEFVKKNAQQFMTDLHPISSQVPFHTVLGNHEYTSFRDGSLQKYYQHFVGQSLGVGLSSQSNSAAYYSLNIGHVHWIALDTELYGEDDLTYTDARDPAAQDNQFHVYFDGQTFVADDSPDRKMKVLARKLQRDWLRQDLSRIDRTETPHVVVAGHRPPYDTDTAAFNQDIVTLLSEFQVDLYVCGHEHSYYAFEAMTVDNGTAHLPPVLITGAAGNKKTPKFSAAAPPSFEDKILFKNASFGYGLLSSNATSLPWEYGTVDPSSSCSSDKNSFAATKILVDYFVLCGNRIMQQQQRVGQFYICFLVLCVVVVGYLVDVQFSILQGYTSGHDSADDLNHPCSSVKSLSIFLSSSKPNLFSRSHPICASAVFHHIHIVIPFYNLNRSTIQEAIRSVEDQHYPRDRFTIWVYDDHSTTTTPDYCNKRARVPFEIPGHPTQNVRLKSHDRRVNCFRSTQHLGPGGSKYWLFRIVQSIAEPNDVVLILDGDDTLLHPQALRSVNEKYVDSNAWFTYGTYDGKWSEQIKDLPLGVRDGTVPFRPRTDTWLYGHPRSFKVFLLDHVTEADFQFKDKTWLIKGTDRGFIYRFLELAGPDRIGYISNKIYKYNYSPKTSTLATIPAEMRVAQIAHTQTMPPSTRLELPIHVVLKKKKLGFLRQQLSWLEQQEGLGKRQLHLHLLVETALSLPAVEAVVLEKRMNVTTTTVVNGSSMLRYVTQLRRKVPLDHVVLLEDEGQYWPRDFVSSLVREHLPKGMTSWYGKVLFENATAEYSHVAKAQLIRGDGWPHDARFKAASLSGGLILDTNVGLLEHHVLTMLASKSEELWLSYVLDALLGWEMRRANPLVAAGPVDLETLVRTHDPEYRRIVFQKHKNISRRVEKEWLLLVSKNPSRSSSRTAAKQQQEMLFQKLQTKFLWDVYSLRDNGEKVMA